MVRPRSRYVGYKRDKAKNLFFTAINNFGKKVPLADGRVAYCVDLPHLRMVFSTTCVHPYLDFVELQLLEMGLKLLKMRIDGKLHYCYTVGDK